MAWCMGLMLDDPDLGAVPGDPRGVGGQSGDETEQIHRDFLGVLRWQPHGDAGLPVSVGQQTVDGGRAAGGAVSRHVAEEPVPEHVVPIGMRRKAGHDGQARLRVRWLVLAALDVGDGFVEDGAFLLVDYGLVRHG